MMAALGLACGPLAAQKIYKCGNTFSQLACGENAQELDVKGRQVDPAVLLQRQQRLEFDAAILREKVMQGMSPKDVLRAWGEPQRINHSAELVQWVYSRGNGQQYVHFSGGVVSDVAQLQGRAVVARASTKNREMCDYTRRNIENQTSSTRPDQRKLQALRQDEQKYC